MMLFVKVCTNKIKHKKKMRKYSCTDARLCLFNKLIINLFIKCRNTLHESKSCKVYFCLTVSVFLTMGAIADTFIGIEFTRILND